MIQANPTLRYTNESATRIADLMQHILKRVPSYQHRMAELLFEISCLDDLWALAPDRRLPKAFRGHMQKVMELFDESLRFALGQLRATGLTVQCRPGCRHCCYQTPTGVSLAELILIYDGMQQTGVSPKFFRRCLEAEELWVEVLHRQSLNGSGQKAGPPLIEALSKTYSGLEQPCPFLETNGCQIYPFRPLACRMHFSLSPPAWCRTSHFQHPHALIFNLEPGECVSNALEDLEDRFQLHLSDVMICGLLELTVNVMRFDKIHWER